MSSKPDRKMVFLLGAYERMFLCRRFEETLEKLFREGLLKGTSHLGIGQEAPVAALFRAAGLAPSPARFDLAGIPRALHARVATMTP